MLSQRIQWPDDLPSWRCEASETTTNSEVPHICSEPPPPPHRAEATHRSMYTSWSTEGKGTHTFKRLLDTCSADKQGHGRPAPCKWTSSHSTETKSWLAVGQRDCALHTGLQVPPLTLPPSNPGSGWASGWTIEHPWLEVSLTRCGYSPH